MRKPNYLKEALRALTGKRYPGKLPDYEANEVTMGCVALVKLQDWCSVNARPPWATGLSMIEAAELIVDQSVENGNIPGRGE